MKQTKGFKVHGSRFTMPFTAIVHRVSWTVLLITCHLLLATNSFAVGTTANTVIVHPTANFEVSFININEQQQPSVNPSVEALSNPVVTVNAFQFFGGGAPLVTRNFGSAGQISTFTEAIYNIGNASVTISVKSTGNVFEINSGVGTLSNWSYSQANPSTQNINQNGFFEFEPEIFPANDAFNNSEAGTSINYYVENYLVTNNQYTGFNNQVYGGYNLTEHVISVVIEGPEIILITRNTTVEAPTGTGFSGAGDALVPGSKLTYQIVIQNIGTTAANNLRVADNIPINTTFFEITAGGSETDVDYNEGAGFIEDLTSSSNVQAVRFELTTLGINNYATFNYTVTVD